jgi:hypothetical protein
LDEGEGDRGEQLNNFVGIFLDRFYEGQIRDYLSWQGGIYRIFDH